MKTTDGSNTDCASKSRVCPLHLGGKALNHFLANISSVGKNSTFFQACDLNVCDLPPGKVFLGSDVSGLALKYPLSFYVICNAWKMVLEAKVRA